MKLWFVSLGIKIPKFIGCVFTIRAGSGYKVPRWREEKLLFISVQKILSVGCLLIVGQPLISQKLIIAG